MNINRYLKFCFGIMVLGGVLMACTKMKDTYDDFVKDGEIYYPGKADSLKVFPGRNRIKLQWLLISDPKITKSVVYWNNKADSIVIPVTRTGGVDTIRTTIAPIAEGTYTFEVYTYDNKGHRSVKVDKIANVYGNNYDITLVNRAIKSATMITVGPVKDTALIYWYPRSIQSIGVDVRYKNTLNDSVFVFANPDSTQKLLKFVKGQAFKFRTLYKPEPNSIDTFFTAYESRTIN